MASETGNVVGMLKVQEHRNQYGYAYGGYPYYDYNKQTPAERYTQMFDLLLSRSLNVSREKDAEQLYVPPGIVRVFIYAKAPREFGVQNSRLANQEGRVLYSLTIPINDSKKNKQ
jgi:hypothetical protein